MSAASVTLDDTGAARRAGLEPGVARPLRRITLADARRERLYFAQVREDPTLEIDALVPTPDDAVVVVSSGGCTALSLLAAGAGRVAAVDLNATQNHVVELKAAAVAALAAADAVAFLGAAPSSRRAATYRDLRALLTPDARAYWDARADALERGALRAGVSERFIGLVVAAVRHLVHSRERVERLLACRSVAEQRALYRDEWDTRRWRLLFTVLLSRRAFDRAYDPAFFARVENPSFPEHFRRIAEHGLTELPVATNYFLHEMFTGRYPAETPGGLPPYLEPGGAGHVARGRERLTLVDGGVEAYLRTQPAGSVGCFALSNICEWLAPAEIERLFGEVVRTAAPGARLCFRNFVGWTEVPERWRAHVVEDRAEGESLIRRDRSLVQSRIAVCRVRRSAR